MNVDLFLLLQQKAPMFSKGQRLLAGYISESYDKAAFMTAGKLGRTVGVSEATVIRFAAELGYDGYPSLQKAMQELILNRLTPVQQIEVANDRIDNQDMVTTVLQSDAENLRQTAEIVNGDAFDAAVRAILAAKNIYILGCGSAAPLVSIFGYYLKPMFNNVRMVTDSGIREMLGNLYSADANDVAVCFSFPRYAAETVKAAQYCRTTGATVIGCTDSSLSPLGQHCDHLLLAKSDMLSFAHSLVAPLSIINALIVSLAREKKQMLQKNIDVLERILEEYNAYEK